MLGEILGRLNTRFSHLKLIFLMLGEICSRSKMLSEGSQQFHCFQTLDEMLGGSNTSSFINQTFPKYFEWNFGWNYKTDGQRTMTSGFGPQLLDCDKKYLVAYGWKEYRNIENKKVNNRLNKPLS